MTTTTTRTTRRAWTLLLQNGRRGWSSSSEIIPAAAAGAAAPFSAHFQQQRLSALSHHHHHHHHLSSRRYASSAGKISEERKLARNIGISAFFFFPCFTTCLLFSSPLCLFPIDDIEVLFSLSSYQRRRPALGSDDASTYCPSSLSSFRSLARALRFTFISLCVR